METKRQIHLKHLSDGELSTSASESDKLMKVQNNCVALNGGKSAIVLFFKQSTKKKSSFEPQILFNNYITDGGLQMRRERFKNSRDVIKKSSRIQTTTSFRPQSNKHKELTIKVTEENKAVRNHTYTGSERKKKKKMNDLCQGNRFTTQPTRYFNWTQNNIDTKSDEKKIQNANSASKIKCNRKPLIIMSEGNANINAKYNIKKSHCNTNNSHDNRSCTEGTDINERKRKMIEELIKRNEQNAFHELQIHLIKETTKKKYNELEKRLNRLKENDVSINSIINQAEEEENEKGTHNQNNPGIIKDAEHNENEHMDNREMEKEIIHRNEAAELCLPKKCSKTQRNSEMIKPINKPRVNVYEYIREISKCYKYHRKSNSFLVNQHSNINNIQNSQSNTNIQPTDKGFDDNDIINEKIEHNSFRKDSRSNHFKSISHSKNSSTKYCNEVKNEEEKKRKIDNEDEYVIDKSKKKLMMNSDDFEQMLLVKVVQDKEKKASNDKSIKEKLIAQFIDLMKLQKTIKEKRKKRNNNKLVKNEFYIGRHGHQTKRSLSQSTIIEQNDYYQNIIQTKGILGEKISTSEEHSLESITKEEYFKLSNLNANQTDSNKKKRLSQEEKEIKIRMIENLKQKEKRDKDRESNKEKDNSYNRTISLELLEKVQKTVNKTNLLHSNENIHKFINESNSKMEELKKEIEKNKEILDSNSNTIKSIENIQKERNYADEIVETDNDMLLETPKKKNDLEDIMKRIGDKGKLHNNNSEQCSKEEDKENDQSIKIKTTESDGHKEPLIKEEINLSKEEKQEEGEIEEEEISYNLSPVEPNLPKSEQKENEEELNNNYNKQKETQLKLYNELFSNFGEWYLFFIKRNIMINIVQYANKRFQYQTGIEMLIEIIKREPFYQLNCYCKYMIYSLIFRGCCYHYIKRAFDQLANYSLYIKRVQVFERKMGILFKFISLERINNYGEIKFQLTQSNEDNYLIEEEENEERIEIKNKANNIMPEKENCPSSGNIYYQLDVLGIFISTIRNVFILPAKSHALQKLLDYAILDKEDNNNNEDYISNNNKNKSQHENKEQNEINETHNNKKRDTKEDEASNSSFSIDRTQKSIRQNDLSLLDNSEMSLRALTQFSNKRILSISQLLKMKPGLKLKKHLDELTNTLKPNEAIIQDQKKEVTVNIPSIYERRIDKSNTMSEINDISADKDGMSCIDWEPITSTKSNIYPQIILEENKKIEAKVENAELRESKLSQSEEVIDIKYSTNSNNYEYENQKSLQSNPNIINEDKSEDNVYFNEFNQINVDEISENSENEINVDEFVGREDNKKNNKINEKDVIENVKQINSNIIINDKTNKVNDRYQKEEQIEIESIIDNEEGEGKGKNRNTDNKSKNNNSEYINEIVSIIKLNLEDSKKEVEEINQKRLKSKANNRYGNEEADENNEDNDNFLHPHGIVTYLSPQKEKLTEIIEANQHRPFDQIQITEINDDFIEAFTSEILSSIIKQEVSNKDIPLIPKKKQHHKLDNSLQISRSGSFGASSSSQHRSNSKEIDYLNYSLTIYNTSVFMRSISEIKKEVTLNLFNDQVAPLLFKLIATEIQKNYTFIIDKLSIPLIQDDELLMNSYILKNEEMKNKSKGSIPVEAKTFITKDILKTFSEQNREMRNEDNVASDSYYDNILNECVIDATNEIIEKERYYGEVGVPVSWSIRSKEVKAKYDNDPQSLIKLQEKVLKELNDLMKLKMGLIPMYHEELDNEQIAQDKERKFIKSIKNDLIEEDSIWKSLEGEETEIKLMISRIIMEQLLNEVVEILEHVQFSRKEPLKYQHKSIYACEDIPRLSFQNTTENDNNTNENEDTINR